MKVGKNYKNGGNFLGVAMVADIKPVRFLGVAMGVAKN